MVDSNPLLKLVKARCDEKGWTFADVAKRSKMSVAGLRKLCSGLVDEPRGTTVHNLAKTLGVKPTIVRAACESGR